MRSIALIILRLLFAVTPVAAQTASPASVPVETLYRAAMKTMGNLPEPAFVSFTMQGRTQGLAVDLHDIDHLIWLNIHPGSTPSSWSIRHRTDDYASELLQEDGVRFVSQRSFFDPTWYGAYRALRDGMLNYQVPEKPLSARATPPPDAPNSLREIAVVNVMGPTIYRLDDRGATMCPDGNPGHAIRLFSRDRDPKHQLNEVVVDSASMRLCSMRFGVSDAFGFHGIVEQHYGQVGKYWMQTDGLIDGTMRVFGISTSHGKWFYRLVNMTFPNELPASTFAVPFTQ
ncbi:MAG: hypothetical protein M3126_05680 [Candidatus Eremiobacteraeota bacterium]|nr:hypothetical protein [Candidatus Eremiobacteraeota bacterium]